MSKTIVILSHVVFDDSPYCSFVHNHAKALVKLGYKVIVFASIPWFPVLSNFQKYKKNFMNRIKNNYVQTVDGVQIIYKKTLSFSNFLYDSSINLNGIFYYKSFKKIFSQIEKDDDIEFIDAHTYKIEGYVAYRLKKNYPDIKTTITLHGTSFERNTKTKNGIKSIKKIFGKVDYAVCVSYKFKKILESFGVYNSKVIFNGISQCDLKQLEKNQFKNELICVGRLDKNKRVDIIIKAFSSLKKIYPDLKLKIIGEGEEKNNLENLVKTLNLNDSVVFKGIMKNEDVLKEMSKSFIFVLLSINEGFGIVYIEAMNAGCITIGTKKEGIDGFIINGKNGFLVNSNIDECIKIIDDIYSNKYDLEKIREEAKQDVKVLTWEKNAEEYIKLINN